MNKKFIITLLLILVGSISIYSQNLVINPSFENNSGCPMGPSELTLATGWSDPFVNLVGDTCSTSDYFHSCNVFGAMGVGVPANILGNENARTGNAYAGIITYSGFAMMSCTPMFSDGWREYLQGGLTTPMVAGQEYCISFWVSLADNVIWATDLWGVHFSTTPVAVNCGTVGGNSDLASYGVTPQVTYNGPAITNTNGWTKLQFTYTATGGESYFVIGNFYGSATTYTCVNSSATNPYAYYYIDDVSVTVGTCCDASFTAPSSLCNSDSPVTLVPETPGGIWSGPGVNASGSFDPALAGVGTHIVEYTLACGESETRTIVVNACVSLSVCKETDGTLTVSGGTGPYTWQNETTTQDCSSCLVGCTFPPGCAVNVTGWVTFGTGTNVSNPGIYPIQVLDNTGGSVIINNASSLTACAGDPCSTTTITINTTITQPTCSTSGSATATATGGATPYNYSWNTTPAQTSQTATGLNPGSYKVTVTDANGCSEEQSVTIVAPTGAPTVTIAATQPTCSTLGSATATAAGGTAPYNYSWNTTPVQTVQTVSNLSAGNYTVTVTDDAGCITTESVTINSAPNAPTVTIAATQPTCSTLGSATATAAGGTAPYNYSWNTTPVQTVQTASNLSAGNYTVTVTDDAGCITTESVTINSAPNAPTVTITSTDIDCSGTLGTATASVTGGTAPYNYSWNTTPAQTTPTATGLSAGTYTVTVTDNAGCSAIEQVVVMNPTQLTVSLDVTDTDCGASNGQITANVMGGTGTYSYTWTPSVGATATVSNLDVGNYDVTVTDENGCTATATGTVNTATTFVLDAIPVNSTIDLGGSVGLDIIVESGITVGTVDWSPAVGLSCTDCINPTASPSTTTTYYVIVTDTSGCIAMDSVVVNVKQPCGDLFVPTMFSPNSDNMNDLECVMGTCVIAIDFTIFDRWGEIVFHTKDRNNCWDGNFRGKPVQSGVYVYKLIATLENGDVVKDTGNINVVR